MTTAESLQGGVESRAPAEAHAGSDVREPGVVRALPGWAWPSAARQLGGLASGSAPSLSIRWRLTLWYTTIVAVMLSAFSLVAYWYLGSSLAADAHALSVERAGQVEELVRRQVALYPFRALDPLTGNVVLGVRSKVAVDDSVDPFQNSGVLVRVFDVAGNFVGGSTVFDGDPQKVPVNYFAVLSALRRQPHAEILHAADGSFYSYTEPAYAENGAPLGVVQILTSRAGYEATMSRLARIFGLGTLFATLLSLALGAAMAHTALAPIDAITRTARTINRRRDLSRRIPREGPRDEVGRLTETFNDMLDRIEAMFDHQRQFLADVSHELRTPLTTIRGELDLLERTGDLDPEGLGAMSEEADRMSRLISDLLLLARADAGLDLRLEAVALGNLVRGGFRQAGTLAGDDHEVRLAEVADVTVRGDRDRLRQLLLILVDNAIRHTPPGTTITLGLIPGSRPGTVELFVADDGPGIDPEHQTRVFDRFYRADKARSRTSGGTGLGLSIAKWIVTGHDGEILVASEPGRGARFGVILDTIDTAQHGGSSR